MIKRNRRKQTQPLEKRLDAEATHASGSKQNFFLLASSANRSFAKSDRLRPLRI
jgi:hypothetical protein